MIVLREKRQIIESSYPTETNCSQPEISILMDLAELLITFDDITLSIRLNQAGEIVEQYLTPQVSHLFTILCKVMPLSYSISVCLKKISEPKEGV